MKFDQLLSEFLYLLGLAAGPTNIDPNIDSVGPAERRRALHKCLDPRLSFGISLCGGIQHGNPWQLVRLLRPCHTRPYRERPRRRAPEPGDEVAPFHSITSSARSKIDGATARPSALAVLRFRTISNFVGNCTGRSAGFAPRRMRST